MEKFKQMKIKEMFNIWKSKYVVNYSDWIKKHDDGSEFRDIAIFKNKKKKDIFIWKLLIDNTNW